MDFITTEVATELGLTTETIAKLTPLYENKVADLKKDWDGKANTDAEKILDGAIVKIAEVTKVNRNQGEKVADYIQRASEAYLSTLKTELDTAKAEYDKKLKEFKGDEATAQELANAKSELDKAKQTLADYDSIKEKADKYDTTASELSGLKLTVAYQSVKPNFPDTVNEYEATAKWNAFEKATNEKYIIELVENEPYYIDRENEHKRGKLKDLVDKDANITQLMQGRKQEGTGGRQVDVTKVEGVPFDVPKELDSDGRSKLIREYLLSQNIPITSDEYKNKFAQLNTKIKNASK